MIDASGVGVERARGARRRAGRAHVAEMPRWAIGLGRGSCGAVVARGAKHRLVRHRRAIASGGAGAAAHLAGARHHGPGRTLNRRAQPGSWARVTQRAQGLAGSPRRWTVVGRLANSGSRRAGRALMSAGAQRRRAGAGRTVVARRALDRRIRVGRRRRVWAVVASPARKRNRRS